MALSGLRRDCALCTALLHGDLAGAVANNPLLIVLGPALVTYGLWQRLCAGRNWTTTVPPWVILGLLAVVIVFAVLRNLPLYPLTLLAPH